MSILIHDIVGELHFVKEDRLLHPLNPSSRRVLVNIESIECVRLGLARYVPLGVVVFVAVVVHRHHVHQEYILWLRLQPGHIDFERWKHSPVQATKTILNRILNVHTFQFDLPATLCYYHFCAYGRKLLPELTRLESHLNVGIVFFELIWGRQIFVYFLQPLGVYDGIVLVGFDVALLIDLKVFEFKIGRAGLSPRHECIRLDRLDVAAAAHWRTL